MSVETAVIFFVLFMVNTWWNYRAGYRRGAIGGHLVAIHDMTEFLMEKKYLDATNASTDKPATVDEMTVYFINTLTERRQKRLEA
jgi:hypothetical protein